MIFFQVLVDIYLYIYHVSIAFLFQKCVRVSLVWCNLDLDGKVSFRYYKEGDNSEEQKAMDVVLEKSPLVMMNEGTNVICNQSQTISSSPKD